jgi:outer membrane protein assembly factor BamD (BamD/ComL family)
MHEQEINYFLEGLKDIKGNFFIDAIEQFKKIVTEFPDSELADDAEYNISLCYYELNQFDNAIVNLQKLIIDYPDATITILGAGNEFGRTAAKAYLLMVNCYLALGKLEKTKEILTLLEPYTDSYVMNNGERVTYHELAKRTIDLYNKMHLMKEI